MGKILDAILGRRKDTGGLVPYFKTQFKGMAKDSGTNWPEIYTLNSIRFDTGAARTAIRDGVFGGDDSAYHEQVNAAQYNGSAEATIGPNASNYTYRKLRERVLAAGFASWPGLDEAVTYQERYNR